MKKIIFYLFCFFLSVSVSAQKTFVCDGQSNRIRLFENKDEVYKEINFISNNISNVGIKYSDQSVFLHFNVCDDSTNSIFEIMRVGEFDEAEHTMKIWNVPANNHYPLLYCCTDSTLNPAKNNFYVFYKILETGEKIHIITMILLKQYDGVDLSNKNSLNSPIWNNQSQ